MAVTVAEMNSDAANTFMQRSAEDSAHYSTERKEKHGSYSC